MSTIFFIETLQYEFVRTIVYINTPMSKSLTDLIWDLRDAGAKEHNPYMRIQKLKEKIETLELRYLQATGEKEREDIFEFEIKKDIDISIGRILAELLLLTDESDRDIYEVWDTFLETIKN